MSVFFSLLVFLIYLAALLFIFFSFWTCFKRCRSVTYVVKNTQVTFRWPRFHKSRHIYFNNIHLILTGSWAVYYLSNTIIIFWIKENCSPEILFAASSISWQHNIHILFLVDTLMTLASQHIFLFIDLHFHRCLLRFLYFFTRFK